MSINSGQFGQYYCKLHKSDRVPKITEEVYSPTLSLAVTGKCMISMRRIYFIRHCQYTNEDAHRCISRTDFSLNAVGKEQAETLKKWLSAHPVAAIYTSPLKRCAQTAHIMAEGQTVHTKQNLAEVMVGAWEGLLFSEIKQRWPAEYAARGAHMGTAAPPGGESFAQGAGRLQQALEEILEETAGDILVVTHAGILRGWLCQVSGISPDRVFDFTVPYGSITEVCLEGTAFLPEKIGYKPEVVPGKEEIDYFYRKCGTPMEVQRHCQAVARKVRELSAGLSIDRELLYAAASLHDMCRTEGKEHPGKAAAVLAKAGYNTLARIVAMHHDLPEGEMSEEAELLYLADKLLIGTEPITLEERFRRSREKCKDDAAVTAWQKRYDMARRLAEKYKG